MTSTRITSEFPTQHTELHAGALVDGRYRVERLIDKGGMGSVYLARQLPLNRLVAVKTLRPVTTDEDQDRFIKRFRQEAEALAALKHPNIVTIYDYGETAEGDCFLAMEYIEGCRFNDLLKGNRRPDPARVVRLTLQICSALQYAHHRGVIHRDIKLSNVLIEGGAPELGPEQAKVVDFGLAKLRDGNQDLTRAGTVLGSPHFMAPEQIKEEPVDHRVDIYSVGVLLYCGLTGKYPFHGHSKATTIAAHLAREIPPFREMTPDVDVPAQLEETVRRCLAKRPDDRYPDMAALLIDLGHSLDQLEGTRATDNPALGEDTLRLTQGRPNRTMTGPRRVIPSWAVSVAVGAILLLGFVAAAVGFGFLVSTRTDSETTTTPTAVAPAAAARSAESALVAPLSGSVAPDPIPSAPVPVAGGAVQVEAAVPTKPSAYATPRGTDAPQAATEPTESPAPESEAASEPAALEPASLEPKAPRTEPERSVAAQASQAPTEPPPTKPEFKAQPDYRDPWAEH